jgi:hypothetical protein
MAALMAGLSRCLYRRNRLLGGGHWPPPATIGRPARSRPLLTPRKYPWTSLQSWSERKLSLPGVSTPSARQPQTAAEHGAHNRRALPVRVEDGLMKERPILILSNGKARRLESDEYPVPKSSIAIRTPNAFSPDHAPRGAFLHVLPAAVRRRSVRLDRCASTRCATRLGLICLHRRRVGARSPAVHGPDSMRPSATARNNAPCGQLVGS